MASPTKPRLGDAGAPIYVTADAARSYAEYHRIPVSTAQVELAEMLVDAKLSGDGQPGPTGAVPYRLRNRQQGDLSARVVRVGDELHVVGLTARDWNVGRPGGAKKPGAR